MQKTVQAQPLKIAVLAFNGINPFHLSVPSLVFGTTTGDGNSPSFEVIVCSVEDGPLRTTAGFTIATAENLATVDDADIIILPAWHDDLRAAPATLLNALRRSHERGARVVGLCLGAFPLAEAGLLDGRIAATHWESASELTRKYPKVKVDSQVLYVDEGNVLTSAGVAAGLDCCLHLLRQISGAETANWVARRLLIAPHRQGGQAQFIERPVPMSNSDSRLSKVIECVTEHLDQQHSVDSLAEAVSMSRRNFTRHFRQTTGTSFKRWLLSQRLAHAQRILESSEASIEIVAQAAGFGSALSLRQHFHACFHTTPSAYRKQFKSGLPVPH